MESVGQDREFEEILLEALRRGASDVFVIAGIPLTYKVNGHQVREESRPLMPEDTQKFVERIYQRCSRDPEHYRHDQVDDDFSFSLPQRGRFRVNVFKQRGSLAVVLRVIKFGLPDPQELKIPEEILAVAHRLNGLVLVTGPTGQGKSTTLACLIDEINKTRETHIITMEDPIEYIHRHNKSIVTQRELMNDTKSYAVALRAALRESPDVILLGEMRDLETIETAMTAAETGQLLFSTLHTMGAANTIDRVVDVFPVNQQYQIRMQLSMVLQAVISQQLVPSLQGALVPAFEIMFSNPAIRNLIRESKTFQIDSAIQAGASVGMCTMDASLLKLHQEGVISAETALMYSIHYEAMEKKLEASCL